MSGLKCRGHYNFAAELVLELLCQQFSDIVKIGAHIVSDKAPIDFSWHDNLSLYLPSVQQAAQNIIDTDSEYGARGRNRTGMRGLASRDFKSGWELKTTIIGDRLQ